MFKKQNKTLTQAHFGAGVSWNLITPKQLDFLSNLVPSIGPPKIVKTANQWRMTSHQKINTFQLRQFLLFGENDRFSQTLWVWKFWLTEDELSPITPQDFYLDGIVCNYELISDLLDVFGIERSQILKKAMATPSAEVLDEEISKLEEKKKSLLTKRKAIQENLESIVDSPQETAIQINDSEEEKILDLESPPHAEEENIFQNKVFNDGGFTRKKIKKDLELARRIGGNGNNNGF
jgi:hypothetical protein